MTAVRRLAAALLAVAGLVLATAAPASAHAGGAEPGDWLAVVDAVSPEMPGVSLQLVDRGEEVELEFNFCHTGAVLDRCVAAVLSGLGSAQERGEKGARGSPTE